MQGSDNSRSKQFIEKFYLYNNKDQELTLNKLLSGDIPEEGKIEIKIIELEPKSGTKMIDTSGRAAKSSKVLPTINRDYVLEEFKDILFPKKKSKYELNHDRAMELKRLDDEDFEKEARKRILYLAANQYDDDPEESVNRSNMK